MRKILIIIVFIFLSVNNAFARSDFSPEEIEEIKNVLSDYYRVYEIKNFTELDNYLADDLPQYISLTNTTPQAVIKNAEKFFANKSKIDYQPYFNKMTLSRDEDGSIVVKFGILLVWEVTDSDIKNNDRMNTRNVDVLTRIIFDQDKKIKSYYEDKVFRPQYKLIRELKAYLLNKKSDQDPDYIVLPEGTIVTDDFTITASNSTSSSWTYFARQVIYDNEKYLVDHYAYYDNAKTYDYYLELVDYGLAEEDKRYFDLSNRHTDWQLAFNFENENVIADFNNQHKQSLLHSYGLKYYIIIYSIIISIILLVIIIIIHWLLKKKRDKEMLDL